MPLTADQITIAVTVYNRRQFVRQAVASALEQTVPVRVIVVEDCGPDPTMQDFVKSEFGQRVTYVRNERRRGLFGNWNACVEHCDTGWLSILHDDDYVSPKFVESMLELSVCAPECGLYFGATEWVDERGGHLARFDPPSDAPWVRVTLEDGLWATPFSFPGQLFKAADVRALGGFRQTSQYCGDWEMWCKLISRFGAAQTRVLTGHQRQHGIGGRGTTAVVRSGRQYPLSYVQHKRVLALLRQAGKARPFDRARYQKRFPVPTRFLLQHGGELTPRLFAYHWRLLLLSKPPHAGYAAFQAAARILGPLCLRSISTLFQKVTGRSSAPTDLRKTLR